MRKLLLLLPLVLLAALAWWLVGDAPPVETAGRAPAEELADARDAAALRGVDAEAESVADGPARAELAAAEPEEEPGAAPRPEEGVVVFVTDVHGRRIAGATVGWRREEAEVEGETTADDEGVAELPLETPLPRTRVWAQAEGFARASVRASGSRPFTLRLAPLTQLAGRVLEAGTRRPLAGVELRVEHPGCGDCDGHDAASGPDGAYAYPAIPADVDLTIRARGTDVGEQAVRLRLALEEGPHAHDLVLERGTLLRGTVVDLVTGTALEGAAVSAAGSRLGGVETDAAGRFELRAVPASTRHRGQGSPPVVVEVERDGCSTLRADLTRSGADLDAPLELPLVLAARLEGVVRDDAGEPVAAASVQLLEGDGSGHLVELGYVEYVEEEPEVPEDAGPLPPSPLDDLPEGWEMVPATRGITETDASGRYVLEGLRPWTAHVALRARREGYETVELDLDGTPAAGETLRRDLVLVRAAQSVVVGTMTVNGNPVHGRVHWRQRGSSGSELVIQGPFRLELEPGPVELEARPLGYDRDTPLLPGVEGHLRSVEVPERGEVRADLTLRYEPATVRGRIVDDAGEPVPGVYAYATLPDLLCGRSAPTPDDGSFEIEVPAAGGPYTVTGHQGRRRAIVEGVAAGREDVVIVLPRAAELRLRVRDAATGAPLEATVEYRRNASEHRRRSWSLGHPDPDGWRIVGLPAGSVDVRVADAAGEYLPLDAPVVLAPGAETVLDAGLERGTTVELVFEPPLPEGTKFLLLPAELVPSGTEAASLRTVLRDVDLDVGRLVAPAGARAELRGLAPGAYVPFAAVGEEPLEALWTPARVQVSVKEPRIELRWRAGR